MFNSLNLNRHFNTPVLLPKLLVYKKQPKTYVKINYIYNKIHVNKYRYLLNKYYTVFLIHQNKKWIELIQNIFFWTKNTNIVYSYLLNKKNTDVSYLLLKGKMHLKGSVKKRYKILNKGFYSTNSHVRNPYVSYHHLYHRTGITNLKLIMNFECD